MTNHPIPTTTAEAKALRETLLGQVVTLTLFQTGGGERTGILRSFDRRSGAGIVGNCETITVPFRDIVAITTEN